MNEQITPKGKDQVLNLLCTSFGVETMERCSNSELSKATGIGIADLRAILRHFDDIGLIEDLNAGSMGVHFVLKVKALDLRNRGGFTVIEKQIENEVQKALLEIEVLKKSLPTDKLEVADRITSILSTVMIISQAFIGK